jgi:hypothetical protein
VDDDLKDVMRGSDAAVVLGMGASPFGNLNLGIRYNIGFTDIYTADDSGKIPVSDYPKIMNRVFHFYLGYSF